jgi:hypothetical protein
MITLTLKSKSTDRRRDPSPGRNEGGWPPRPLLATAERRTFTLITDHANERYDMRHGGAGYLNLDKSAWPGPPARNPVLLPSNLCSRHKTGSRPTISFLSL